MLAPWGWELKQGGGERPLCCNGDDGWPLREPHIAAGARSQGGASAPRACTRARVTLSRSGRRLLSRKQWWPKLRNHQFGLINPKICAPQLQSQTLKWIRKLQKGCVSSFTYPRFFPGPLSIIVMCFTMESLLFSAFPRPLEIMFVPIKSQPIRCGNIAQHEFIAQYIFLPKKKWCLKSIFENIFLHKHARL